MLSTRLLLGKASEGNRQICLTFDDGPNPWATESILQVLEQSNIPAAFFMLGRNIARHPALAKEVFAQGHIIGNHTFNHPLMLTLCSPESQRDEIEKTEKLLESLQIPNSRYYRPPHTFHNRKMLLELSDYSFVGVNHYVVDNLIFSAKLIASRMMSSIRRRGGGIIVLHEGTASFYDRTRSIIAGAVTLLIPQIISEGYTFTSLDEIRGTNVILGRNRGVRGSG